LVMSKAIALADVTANKPATNTDIALFINLTS
jgi:hypothetical protein